MSVRGGPADAASALGAGMSAEVFPRGSDRVLKLYREPSEPAAIENEYRANALARAGGIPTARAIAVVREDGRTGILFERLHGATMLAHHARDPLGLLRGLHRLARIQRAIHACSGRGLPAQAERLRTEIGWARLPAPVRAAALAALDRLPAGEALCHGDIHPGNALVTPDGLRVVDWQKASAGRPAADLARTQMILRHGRLGGGRLARHPAAGRILGLAAAWYGLSYRAAGRAGGEAVSPAEVAAWRLPLLAAKLCSRATDKDDEILDAIDRLMRADRRNG